MTDKKEVKKKNVAKPYHDVRAPFTVDEKGSFADYIIGDPTTMPDLALGAHVLIRDARNGKDLWITGRVVGLRAVSPFSPDKENMLYVEDEQMDPTAVLSEVTGPHTHQPMIIQAKLERELEVEDNQESREFNTSSTQRPPSAISRLFFPNLLPIASDPSPSLQEILKIKPQGVPLGCVGFGSTPYTSNNQFLQYKWDVDDLDNKHISIVGQSGSGKTVLLKNLAYEIRRNDPDMRVIMTDVQGDIVQLLLPDIADILQPKGWQNNIDRDDVKKIMEHLGVFQLVIPAKKDGTQSANVRALRFLTQSRGILVKEIGLRLQDLDRPSDVEYLFKVSSEQAAMLLDEEAEYLRNRNPSEPASIANLRNTLNSLIASHPRDAEITNHAGTTYYKSTYHAAIRALTSLTEHFDFHQASLSVENNPLDCFNFNGTTILYLGELNIEEKIMWEMQLVKWLYDHKMDNWKAFAFFDEAHQIIPAYPTGFGSKETFDRLRRNFEYLSREGRKFGIHLVLSTQNPKDLHPIVPEQCDTKIIMKIDPRNAPHLNIDQELAYIANGFSQGQFWIYSPFNGSSNWVRIHSWAPALPHMKMTEFWNKVIAKAKEEYEKSKSKT